MVDAMDKRKKEILKAIIHEHILTAEPIGSRTLAKNNEIGVSSATIRNEMADLEELGFLEQPYTSAGRVPSDLGYRYYVDYLMDFPKLTKSNINNLFQEFNNDKQGIQTIMSGMVKMLSRLTRYTVMISEPQLQKSKIKQIQLIPITSKRLIVVIITDTGIVHNKVIKLEQEINTKQLRYLNHFLSVRLKNKKLANLNQEFMAELELELINRVNISQNIFQLIYKELEQIKEPAEFKIYLGGTSYILEQPEFNDLNLLKSLLNILEQEEILRDLLKNIPTQGIKVVIGQENDLEVMQNCSVVYASYSLEGRELGKIGVIGPTRMEYPRVITTVNTVANVLSKIIFKLSR